MKVWVKWTLVIVTILWTIPALSLWFLSHRWKTEFDAEVRVLQLSGAPIHSSAMAPHMIPDADNAAPSIMAAGTFLESLSQAEEPDFEEYLHDKELDVSALESWVSERREYYDRMTEALGRPQCRYPVEYSKGCLFENPASRILLRCGRANGLRAILLSRKGGGSPARDLQAILRLSRSLSGEPLLVSQLIRYVLFEFATDLLKSGQIHLSTEEWQALGRSFAAESFPKDYSRAMEMERAMGIEICRTLLFKGSLATSADIPPQSIWWVAPFAPRGGTAYLRRLNRIVELSMLPYPLAHQHESTLQKEAYLDRSWDTSLANLLTPAYTKIHEVMTKAETSQALAIAYCKINAEGRIPESLETPDPFTAKPMHYRSTPEGFQLWSSGPNQIDDGGDEDDIAISGQR